MAAGLGQCIEDRISGARLHAATYNVHGLVTKVYADHHFPALAIQDFLRPFRGQPGSPPDMKFYILTKEPDFQFQPDHLGNTEVLYDWNVLKYAREGRLRYQEVPGAGWVVADPGEGLAVAFVEKNMMALPWSLSHVIFFPMWAQLLKARGIFPVHAAGLERNGKGILFPGKSGCGKSTLSCHLLEHGYRLLGDDTVFVRRSGSRAQMLFFPEEVDITADMLDLSSNLAMARRRADDRWQPKERINLSGLGRGRVVESSLADILVFPRISRDGKTSYDRVGGTEALAELILYSFLFMDPQTSKENFALLANLVQTAKCYRLHMGPDGAEVAAAVDDIIAAA